MNPVVRAGWLAVLLGWFSLSVQVRAQTTFAYTGSTQTYTVPTGVQSIRIKVWGAGGGAAANITGSYGAGGGAGFVQADIAVTPGQQITVTVGQGGAGWSSTEGYAGATYPNGGTAVNDGGGGGGRTEVTGSNFDLIASGGGGGGYYFSGNPGQGGYGGATTGGAGGSSPNNVGGQGGSQSGGGSGGHGDASTGSSGASRSGGAANGANVPGGAGGDGYYGGGAGGGGLTNTGDSGGGGGGGSDYTSGSVTNVVNDSGSGSTPGNSSDSARLTSGCSTLGNYGAGIGATTATYRGGNGEVSISALVTQPVITSALSESENQGQSVSYQITAVGNPTSYGATGLPTGLSINTSTGQITGNVTQTGTVNTTLSATNSYGTQNATLVWTITAAQITDSASVVPYTVQTFTNSSTFPVPYGVTSVQVLVVAGGGGGSSGGGGGGGVVYNSAYAVTPLSNITVTVGAGGTGAAVSSSSNAGNGQNSVFGSITAIGGGGGGSNPHGSGSSGGSGGGAGSTGNGPYTRASGTSGQGSNGGTNYTGANFGSGGGGGASAAGGDGSSSASGNGGAGYTSTISGQSATYGGGGGGACYYSTPGNPGSGGAGGGGSGNQSGNGNAGTAGTGGGGGGASYPNTGGAGGNGAVIVKWPGYPTPPIVLGQSLLLTRAGTANFGISHTENTIWPPPGNGSINLGNMQLGSMVYTPVSGAGSYSYQFRIVDIYSNYVDQYINFTVNAVAVDPPSTVTATITGTTYVTLSWSGAAAQNGIASYNVYRGGVLLGNTTSTTLTDSTTTASTTYSYTVVTVDTQNNDSPASLPLAVTTAADFEVFTPIP